MLPSVFGENLFDDFFDDFDEFDRRMDRYFNGRHGLNRELYGKKARNMMKTDVRETDDTYELDIDLPGFTKDEVNVGLHEGYLTVTAAKGLDKDQEEKDGRYIRRERYAGSCSRTFYVGNLNPSDIKCKYESGVLQLTVPKMDREALKAQNRIAIE